MEVYNRLEDRVDPREFEFTDEEYARLYPELQVMIDDLKEATRRQEELIKDLGMNNEEDN